MVELIKSSRHQTFLSNKNTDNLVQIRLYGNTLFVKLECQLKHVLLTINQVYLSYQIDFLDKMNAICTNTNQTIYLVTLCNYSSRSQLIDTNNNY